MGSISRFCDSMMLKSQEILHWKIVLETKYLVFSLEIFVLTSRIYYINAQMSKWQRNFITILRYFWLLWCQEAMMVLWDWTIIYKEKLAYNRLEIVSYVQLWKLWVPTIIVVNSDMITTDWRAILTWCGIREIFRCVTNAVTKWVYLSYCCVGYKIYLWHQHYQVISLQESYLLPTNK